MKIVNIGICTDNKDPRGIGRIRVRDISETESDRSKAIPVWEQWGKNDPFVYSPFLPTHINIIPQKEQAVKIIRYDNEKDLQNQEYIPGPFTTTFDYSYQNELSQLTETTYAKRSEKSPAIKSFTGEKKSFDDGFIRAESVGTLPKLNDIGLVGNYGSDIILTEHGVQLRAGKLVDKFATNPKFKTELSKYPIFSKKQSKVSLKKFPQTLQLDKKIIVDDVISRTDIKHVVEYKLDNVLSPTEVTVYIYRINKTFGEKYKTDVFGINTELDIPNSAELVYEDTQTLESSNKQQEAYILIRDFISRVDRENLIIIEPTLPDTPAHPFYFRPKNELRNQNGSTDFLTNVYYNTRTNGFGLIYSRTSMEVPVITQKKEVPYLKKVSEVDQTFAAITADQIIHMSTINSGVDGKNIDFGALDKYEYTQEDYLMRILPNTFSSVRGEKLIEILELITLILLNHTHGIITPPKYFKATTDSLKRLIERAKIDMINSSIRIN